MDGKGEGKAAEQSRIESPGPAWRAWLLSIVAAIVLSAAATLLLGGSFRLPGGSNAAAGGCGSGAGGPCCPPRGEGGR